MNKKFSWLLWIVIASTSTHYAYWNIGLSHTNSL